MNGRTPDLTERRQLMFEHNVPDRQHMPRQDRCK